MSTFQLNSLVVTLYEPERIPADFLGLKGYNIYHATLPLHYTDIPICVAHRTLKRKSPPGTIARIRGSCSVAGRTLLVTASTLIPAAIEPVRGDIERPRRFHCLPRVFLAGVVSSTVSRLASNNQCLIFDVTIDRPDVYPGVALTVSCWIHRDQTRFSLLEELVTDTAVIITGVGCGWTWDDKLMVDVYSITYNNEGPAPPVRATDPPNPFRRAVWRDGFPVFPPLVRANFAPRSLLCMDAMPSLAPAPAFYYDRSRDPRLLGVKRKPGSLEARDDRGSSTAGISTPSAALPSSTTTTDAPSVHDVRRAARRAAAQRTRSRVARARLSPRVSSPDVPLRIKISAKQIASLA